MTGETAREISTSSEGLKRLAKYLAQQCFRKTILEDLHAGLLRTRKMPGAFTYSLRRANA
jgi:hypothetical protein